MMEVDQPGASEVDNKVMPEETAEIAASESSVASPDKIIQESDDLPALVISDSEGDEMSAAETEKIKARAEAKQTKPDISGVTPLDATELDVDVKGKDASQLEGAGSVPPEQIEAPKPAEETVAEEQHKVSTKIYENIDLTGTSSADDSGVSDQGCEPTSKKGHAKAPKMPKDTSNLTAQELLQALLELQEDSSDEEEPVNNEGSTQQREQNSGVESQLNQQMEVSNPPEKVAVVPQEQVENAAMGDESAENQEALGLSMDPSENAGDSVCAEVDSKQTIESDTVAHEAEKDQAEKTTISFGSTNKANDVDDDVVCLLEEMDDPVEFDKDMDDDDLDGNSSSGGDSATPKVDDCDGQSNGNEKVVLYESTVKAVLESKETEVDSIEEPPNKRARSDEGEHVDNNFDSIATSQQSDIIHDCNIEDGEAKSSESRKADNSHQAVTQTANSSRPSSSIGNPMEGIESLNTDATQNTTEPNSTQTRPEETASHNSEVLIIEDDDDDDVMDNAPIETADQMSSADVEAREKRPQDVEDEPAQNRPNSAEPSVWETQPLRMDFMHKFSKPFSSMTRDNLEELVSLKICEALAYKTKLVEERKRSEIMEKSLQNLRLRLTDVSKQYSDLKVVHDRVVLDLRRKASQFVQPVKITRAVGLQVNLPQQTFQSLRTSMEPPSGGVTNSSATLSVIPMHGNGASGSGTAGNTTNQTTNIAQDPNGVQRMAGSVGGQHPTPNVIRTSRPMNVTFMHNATPSAVTIKPSASTRNGMTNTERPQSGGSSSSSSSSSTGGGTPNGVNSGNPSGSVTARKKTAHKITPKRPPLSADQQQEQEQMARQQQQLFLQDMHNQQQARMAQIAGSLRRDGAENSPAGTSAQNVSDVGQRTARTTPTHSRTVMVPPQATAPSAAFAVNNGRVNNRMAPSISNSMTVGAGKPITPASTPSPQHSRPSSSAVENSLIDLTDEEEPPRVSGSGGVANLANLAARNRQNDQNGPPGQPDAPAAISTAPAELIASNQILRLSMAARQQNKRTFNGHVVQRPPATGVAGSNPSGTKFGSMQANSGTNFRPVLTKRPPGHIQPAGMSTLTNGQARHSGPLVSIYPAGAAPRSQNKLPTRPAPQLPLPERHSSHPHWKKPPPKPAIRINNVPTGIVISWSMPELSAIHAEIEKYQIYAYQEVAEPGTTDSWRHVGDVNALPLPMAVTLTHFNAGQRYHFAVRAIDQHQRSGFFSEPRTW